MLICYMVGDERLWMHFTLALALSLGLNERKKKRYHGKTIIDVLCGMSCDVVGGTGARMIKQKKRNELKMNFEERKSD